MLGTDGEGDGGVVTQRFVRELFGGIAPEQQQYGAYLMPGENVQTGFRLVRDTFILTNNRLILYDHQGVTGKKTRVVSIDMDSIYDVAMETAGTGFDDSELTI